MRELALIAANLRNIFAVFASFADSWALFEADSRSLLWALDRLQLR